MSEANGWISRLISAHEIRESCLKSMCKDFWQSPRFKTNSLQLQGTPFFCRDKITEVLIAIQTNNTQRKTHRKLFCESKMRPIRPFFARSVKTFSYCFPYRDFFLERAKNGLIDLILFSIFSGLLLLNSLFNRLKKE